MTLTQIQNILKTLQLRKDQLDSVIRNEPFNPFICDASNHLRDAIDSLLLVDFSIEGDINE